MWGRLGLVVLMFLSSQMVGRTTDPVVQKGPGLISGYNDPGRQPSDSTIKTEVLQTIDYSVLFSNFLFFNWLHEKNANQAGFLQNMKYHLEIEKRPLFKFSGTLGHSLGFLCYFDSITKVQTDNNTLTVHADLFPGKRIHLDLGLVAETQLLNGYTYSTINGSSDRTRVSSFLTPLVCTISLGGAMEWKQLLSVNFSLTGFKITWLRDPLISRRYAESLYNIQDGKSQKTEFGLSFHFLADHELFHCVTWNCDLLLFKNYRKSVDMNLKNLFGIRINRFLKTNIQTRILYEKQVEDRLQVENMISFGFYFHR